MGAAAWYPACVVVSLSAGGLCQQLGDADQVVGGDRKGEHRLGLSASADLDLCKPGLRLDPAEHLLDALADPLADGVAGMARRAAVDRGPAHHPAFADRAVDGNVRRHLALAQVLDEGAHVVSLVGPERDAAAPRAAVEHGKRRLAFRRPGGARERGLDRKAVAVLHQDVPHEAQPALAAVGLAIEPRVRVGRRGMALVRALLLAEVALAVAPRPRRRARAVLR